MSQGAGPTEADVLIMMAYVRDPQGTNGSNQVTGRIGTGVAMLLAVFLLAFGMVAPSPDVGHAHASPTAMETTGHGLPGTDRHADADTNCHGGSVCMAKACGGGCSYGVPVAAPMRLVSHMKLRDGSLIHIGFEPPPPRILV